MFRLKTERMLRRLQRNATMTDRSQPKHAVIVCHPDEDSFTMSVAKTYCAAVAANGQTAVLRDLYRIGFDPVLKAAERDRGGGFVPAPDVAAELDLLRGADAFVLVYPIWFGTPPAMLKGYVERVLGAGFSFEALSHRLEKPLHPLLGGKQLLSFSSSGMKRQWLEEQGAWLSLQTIFDGYLARAFWMSTPEHVHFDSVHEGMEAAAMQAHFAAVEVEAARMCARLRPSIDEADLLVYGADRRSCGVAPFTAR
jgi:NAD(P)H dehydrogenase (quinone)